MIRVDLPPRRDFTVIGARARRAATGRAGRLAQQRLVGSAGPKVVRKIRTRVRAVQVTSTRGGTAPPVRSTNLRGRAAAATESAAVEGGLLFYVAGWQLGMNGTRLAQYLDTEDLGPRWRHPVFARADREREDWVWTEQTGQPWFYSTIRASEADFEAAIEHAMDKIVKEMCA